MLHLTKSDPIYLDIIHAIYRTCLYTASTYGFALEDDITSLPTKIRESDGITYINFQVPVIEKFRYTAPLEQYLSYFQETLDLVTSSEVPLKKYRALDFIIYTAPVLIVNKIWPETDYADVEVFLVNNSVSYKAAKEKKIIPRI